MGEGGRGEGGRGERGRRKEEAEGKKGGEGRGEGGDLHEVQGLVCSNQKSRAQVWSSS